MTDHENAAFNGAASVKKTEPTYEQSMTQPWKYPQGRLPPEEYKNELLTPLSLGEAIAFWSVPVAIGLLLLVGAIAMFW